MTGRGSTGLRKKHALQLFKTDMCNFFMKNRCDNGDRCSYAQNMDEVRSKPDLTATSMCRALAQTGSCDDPTCRFAHSDGDLRATHGFFKMKIVASSSPAVARTVATAASHTRSTNFGRHGRPAGEGEAVEGDHLFAARQQQQHQQQDQELALQQKGNMG
eukprot:CAMPEP_0177266718 /NCGR_PEP_ID=MMETSP0367-20130122/62836_1 /TAXON_ID=447022 ORGANISM="Scrippsiella hangoei-like, Strain SHHI-4" /NCGR_SAMPLE_ID=MMETSP0367 /ASSEMBLY_ACC=CAM_ASM_000362 /LENGTH=159 /DNA_ID=CAMNT_0018722111 /DNA_START=21 /DNA_END=497 /DNA_ORIENTATION=+